MYIHIRKELLVEISIIVYSSLDQYKLVVSIAFTMIPKTMDLSNVEFI
jgi:hypothetical protein